MRVRHGGHRRFRPGPGKPQVRLAAHVRGAVHRRDRQGRAQPEGLADALPRLPAGEGPLPRLQEAACAQRGHDRQGRQQQLRLRDHEPRHHEGDALPLPRPPLPLLGRRRTHRPRRPGVLRLHRHDVPRALRPHLLLPHLRERQHAAQLRRVRADAEEGPALRHLHEEDVRRIHHQAPQLRPGPRA